MNIDDRFTRGFLAGLASGVVTNIFSFISFALNWVKVRYLDWAGVFIFGREPGGAVEVAISLAGQLFFSALLGVIFAYLIPLTTSKSHIFKGLVYGLAVWFASYAIAILYKVPPLTHIGIDTVTSNIVAALIFGFVLAWSLKWLDQQVRA